MKYQPQLHIAKLEDTDRLEQEELGPMGVPAGSQKTSKLVLGVFVQTE